MPDTGPVVAAFGGIHLDRIGHATHAIRADTSTPGKIAAQPGGVAVNVARVLASLGTRTALCGSIGEDSDGAFLMSALPSRNLNLSMVRRDGTYPTATYLALHNPDGNLAAALVDTRLTEALTLAHFDFSSPEIASANLWFLDANLNRNVLDDISQGAEHRLIAADTVSIAKAGRLAPLLKRLNIVFTNRSEASALLETTFENAAEAARALVEAGVRTAVVSDGAAPLAAAQAEVAGSPSVHHLQPLSANVVDVTGVGDALIGATLHGLLDGLIIQDALSLGAAAAAITLETEGATPLDLSPEHLHMRLKECPK